jgi:hypothetical protein
MIRKLLPFIVTAILTCACSPPPEAPAATASPLYVDQTTGHGPVPCSGATPDHGYLDVWHDNGTCGRVRGDFMGDSTNDPSHPGYIFAPGTDAHWFWMSPNQYTSGWVCSHPATGPAWAPCQGQNPPQQFLNAGDWTFVPFTPAAVLLRYLPFCPNTPGMTRLHQCSGAYTPIDGSGYATAVIDDGTPAHALNLPNPPINAGDCFIELSSYSTALAAQFVPPPGYTHGTRVVAVYTCP